MFDLDAARLAAAEGDGYAGFDFSFHEEKYHLPGMKAWPLQAQEELAEGRLSQVLRLVMGKEDFDRLLAAGLTLGDLNLLFDELGRASGAGDLGNSEASAPPDSTPT